MAGKLSDLSEEKWSKGLGKGIKGSVLDYAFTHQLIASSSDTGVLIKTLLENGFFPKEEEMSEILSGKDEYMKKCPLSTQILCVEIIKHRLSKKLPQKSNKSHAKLL